jgi:predicted nucleic acid-binding protein
MGDPFFVLDASVAIDLINGDLLREVDKLPFTIGIPDVILHKEIEVKCDYFSDQFQYKVIEFSEEQVALVLHLRESTNKISTEDLFAYVSALERSCCLITGDGALRLLCESNKVEVHGLLWILDELIKRDLISSRKASDSLHIILEKGSYLPIDQCKKRFIKWNAPNEYYKNLHS